MRLLDGLGDDYGVDGPVPVFDEALFLKDFSYSTKPVIVIFHQLVGHTDVAVKLHGCGARYGCSQSCRDSR